ncbi:CAP domain-containing protein [bacterium]|nr:CAP domain-containing protein [bacterium]
MFKKKSLFINLLCYAVLISLFTGAQAKADYVSSVEGLIYNMVNQERTSRGLSSLSRHSRLEGMSRVHSLHMYNQGEMSHTSNVSGYETLSDRASKAGVTGWSHLGENVGNLSDPYGYYSTAQKIADAVMKAWMDSSGHRENILYNSFSHIGVGVYEQNGEYYFTQHFAAFHNQPPPDDYYSNDNPADNNYDSTGAWTFNNNSMGFNNINNLMRGLLSNNTFSAGNFLNSGLYSGGLSGGVLYGGLLYGGGLYGGGLYSGISIGNLLGGGLYGGVSFGNGLYGGGLYGAGMYGGGLYSGSPLGTGIYSGSLYGSRLYGGSFFGGGLYGIGLYGGGLYGGSFLGGLYGGGLFV